jgi:AcrR family transcriptional regulator
VARSRAEQAKAPARDRRHLRHEQTKREILDVAWQMVQAGGLAALSLSALSRRVGIEPQSLYTYFSSKHAIYDAMFAQGNEDLLAQLHSIDWPDDPIEMLRCQARAFVEFSAQDPARYQLLFERTIPDFEPSSTSYAIAVEVFETARTRQTAAGLTDDRHFDLWTALVAGLAAQQISNDPGGDRWIRLVDDAVAMYAAHVLA